MTMLPINLPVSMGRSAPSESRRAMTTWTIPLLIAAVVGLVLVAATIGREASATLASAFGVAITFMLVMAIAGLRWRRPKTVSVSSSPGGLVFTPPAVISAVSSIAVGLALLSVVRLWAEPDLWVHLPFQERGAIVVAPLAGVFMMIEPLWSLRRPAGLALDANGLRGVRGGPRVDLRWDQVLKVKVASAKRAQALTLVTLDTVLVIQEGVVSGDVHAVATVVNYYLQNPDERWQLAEGLKAVSHVDAEVRAKRFSSL